MRSGTANRHTGQRLWLWQRSLSDVREERRGEDDVDDVRDWSARLSTVDLSLEEELLVSLYEVRKGRRLDP